MSIKMTGSIDGYGLRLAKKQAKELIASVKGDRSDYARGWRDANKSLIAAIDGAIAAFRKANFP